MKTKIIILLLVAIFNVSCSSDDDGSSSTTNTLTIGNQTFELNSAYVFDENTENNDPSDISISFSNVENLFDTNSTDLIFVYFDVNESTLQANTYTEILDYSVITNGTFTDDDGIVGDVALDDSGSANLQASTKSFTINSITNNQINISFTFVRADGTEISGNYNGSYTSL